MNNCSRFYSVFPLIARGNVWISNCLLVFTFAIFFLILIFSRIAIGKKKNNNPHSRQLMPQCQFGITGIMWRNSSCFFWEEASDLSRSSVRIAGENHKNRICSWICQTDFAKSYTIRWTFKDQCISLLILTSFWKTWSAQDCRWIVNRISMKPSALQSLLSRPVGKAK